MPMPRRLAWHWLKVIRLIDIFSDTAGAADAYGNEFHIIKEKPPLVALDSTERKRIVWCLLGCTCTWQIFRRNKSF